MRVRGRRRRRRLRPPARRDCGTRHVARLNAARADRAVAIATSPDRTRRCRRCSATAAVHHALIAAGLRLRASLVVDTGDARDAHQVAALCAFGASAVCPSLGYDIARSIAPADATGCDAAARALSPGARARPADDSVEDGRVHVPRLLRRRSCSRFSASTRRLVGSVFSGHASPVGGVALADIAATALRASCAGVRRQTPRCSNIRGCTATGATASITRPIRSSSAACSSARRGRQPAGDYAHVHVARLQPSALGCPRSARIRSGGAPIRVERRRAGRRRSAGAFSRRRCRSARCRPKRTGRSRER